MGCYKCNVYTPGGEALASLGYNVDSHGDLSATYDSLINADLPSYTQKFYSPTEHESMSEVRYSKIDIGYDENLREIKEAIAGPPIQAYIPRAVESMDTGSSLPRTNDIVIKNPKRTIVDEILKAQKEILGKDVVLEETEVEEIIIKRRVRKRRVSLKNKGPKEVIDLQKERLSLPDKRKVIDIE